MAPKKRPSKHEDPIVAEVRAAKERLAARFGHDVTRILRDAQRRQNLEGRRLLSLTHK